MAGIQAITNTRTGAAAKAALTGLAAQRQTLSALRTLGRTPDSRDPTVIRQTAAQMVSELFVVPLLEQARQLPFGKTFMDGGRTEAIFGQQLNTRIGDMVAQSGCRSLTAELASKMAPKTKAAQTPAPAATQAIWPAQIQRDKGQT